jgi:cytochrome c oxidase subunit 2
MMKREWSARLLLVLLLTLSLLVVGVGWYSQKKVITLRARMAEEGGWSPSEIKAFVGIPLTLRLVSDDVTHGFAVGKMDFKSVDIYPGEDSEITLTFAEPGRYTYYCTRWCGLNHWRMRGTIDVSNSEPSQPGKISENAVPLYLQLGLDIDAPHSAQVTPLSKPIASKHSELIDNIPSEFLDSFFYRTHSPSNTWEELRSEPFTQEMSDTEVWSLVAAIWRSNTDVRSLEEGGAIYGQNCAACHGASGSGDGVFAAQAFNHADSTDEYSQKTPTDFTDGTTMLGASPAILHGKIVRGGMGTGMPYWGPIFTDEQIWNIVSYLWTFQFQYKEDGP